MADLITILIFIVLMLLAIGGGSVLGYLLTKILVKRSLKKVKKNSINKIAKQTNKFIIDGKPYNLSEEMIKQISENLNSKPLPISKTNLHSKTMPIFSEFKGDRLTSAPLNSEKIQNQVLKDEEEIVKLKKQILEDHLEEEIVKLKKQILEEEEKIEKLKNKDKKVYQKEVVTKDTIKLKSKWN